MLFLSKRNGGRVAAEWSMLAILVVWMMPCARVWADEPSKEARAAQDAAMDAERQLLALQARQAELARATVEKCGLSPENVKPVMLELERERFMLESSLATKPVQVQLLARRVNEITDARQKRAEADSVVAWLEKIKALRQAEVAELKKQVGAAVTPVGELRKAEGELIEAELRLALRREEVAKATGEGDLDRLNRELGELTVASKLDGLRMQQLDAKLKSLQGVLDLVSQYNTIGERIAGISRKLNQ